MTVAISFPDTLGVADADVEARIGGKAAGLLRLGAAGAPVPSWCVVEDEVFAAHWARARVARWWRAPLVAHAGQMQKAIRTADPTKTLHQAVEGALERLGPGPYAVRSSMVGEDSAGQSFAGQLESYLFRHDADAVVAAIVECWASAFAERVLVYRARAEGETPALPRMGVVIQRMIDGAVSGVTFTAHPVTGARDEALITAAWGLGEGVVSGLCNTDEYVWAHRGGERSATVADKDIAVRRAPDGAGTVEVPVPEAERSTRALTAGQLATVGGRCVAIAEAFGSPQDIEWTLEPDGALHVVQSRPITALPAPENTDGPEVVFDNSNIQESYCGVTTPLTFSFASRQYANVYEQTARVLGLPESTIAEYRPVFRNLLGLVRGRIYYNINNWYRGLLLLPSFGTNKADMERMMGLQDPVEFVVDEDLPALEKLRRLPRLLHTLGRLLWRFRRLERDVPDWLRRFEEKARAIDRGALSTATFSQLMDTLARIDATIRDDWATPIVNDFYVMMSNGRLARLLEKTGREDIGALQNNLMAGEEGIESTEPTRALMRLARGARGSDALRTAWTRGTPAEALARIAREHPATHDAIRRYIARYGDRVIGELKLETITLREDPAFLVEVVRNYIAREDLDPDALLAREQRMRAEAEATVRAALEGRDRAKFDGVVGAVRSAVKHRENMRLARTRAFGLYRDVYRALGRRLHAVGQLAEPRDVFFLTVEEIEAYHEGRAVTADLKPIVAARAAEFAAHATGPEPPHHFHTRGPVYHGNRFEGPERPLPEGRVLRGVGCYPGVVEAPLRVILSPEEELSVNGRILCTVRTDPGWAPLFPTTRGILVERGSTLSHSAVVARELGIPAVVGVPGLLAVVRDGERVRLDGGAGTVERLEEEGADG
jgi:pyruvate,water dikinase